MNNQFPLSLTGALEDVGCEVKNAEAKFAAFNSAHEGWAVIKEEMDELWAEVCKGGTVPKDPVAMRKEAVQLAAMVIRFIRDVCDDRGKLKAHDLGGGE